MEKPDQDILQAEGPAVVALVAEKHCVCQLIPVAELATISVVALKVCSLLLPLISHPRFWHEEVF